MNPYEVLGITEGATDEEVKEAYLARAKRYHPDAGGDSWAFKRIEQAFEQVQRLRARNPTASSQEKATPPSASARAGKVRKQSTADVTISPSTFMSPFVVAACWALWILAMPGPVPHQPGSWRIAVDKSLGTNLAKELPSVAPLKREWLYSPFWRRIALVVDLLAAVAVGTFVLGLDRLWQKVLAGLGGLLYGGVFLVFFLDFFIDWTTVIYLVHWSVLLILWAGAVGFAVAALRSQPHRAGVCWGFAALAAAFGILFPALWVAGAVTAWGSILVVLGHVLPAGIASSHLQKITQHSHRHP